MHSVLIVEDDQGLRSNIELILGLEGYRVRSAGDGVAALASVRAERPDLILCDIMMPEMDGHSLLEALKREPLCADIPFIFVTALGERADLRRGMAAGADDYLTKPFTAEELVAAVTGRLHRVETIRALSGGNSFRDEQIVLRETISAREREVLLLVGCGATSREIARQLGISLRTVEVHRSNLMKKLDASNAARLARWAVIAEMI